MTIPRIFDQANNNHGMTLTPLQVREVAGTLMNIAKDLQILQQSISGAEYIMSAYIEEYGDELYNELVEAVEAEVVDDESEDSEETGQASETDGLDSPPEREESGPVSEVSSE